MLDQSSQLNPSSAGSGTGFDDVGGGGISDASLAATQCTFHKYSSTVTLECVFPSRYKFNEMKQLLILFILLSFTLNVWGSELKSGIRVGYDNFGGMQVQFYESSTGKTAEINDWNNPLHLSLIAAPNYLYEGFGWFIKIGFNEFKLNTQRFILDESSSVGGNVVMNKRGDLGTKMNGKFLYLVPSLYYHFFKNSYISFLFGLGFGISYIEIDGEIYITDSFKPENRDTDCYDYLKSNDSYDQVSSYCDLKYVNTKSQAGAWSPTLLIKGENIGFEFAWVNGGLEENGSTWWVNDAQMVLFYQFNFE